MEISEKQKTVSDLLANYDPKARDVYLGALSVLDQDHSEKLPQSAHSIREMLNLITRNVKFRLTSSKKEEPKKESHKKKLIQLVDPLGGPPEELHYQFDVLEEYKEWFLGVSHHGKLTTEKQFQNKLDKLESLLLQIMRPHFEVIAEINNILKNDVPSFQTFSKLKPLLARDVSAFDHFFTHASSDWIDILAKKGYFSKPPPLIKVQQGIRFPLWSASRYLSRTASEKPEKVLRIILKHKIPPRNERNQIILEDFTNAAIKMPSRLAIRMAERISKEKWADIPFYNHLDEPISKLMLKLAEDGYGKHAISLANTLLDVKQGQPYVEGGLLLEEYKLIKDVTTIIDNYWYGEIVKNKLPLLAKKYPSLTIAFLVSLLNKSISLENSGRNRGNITEDASIIWRPAIENHEQNHERDFRSHLIEVLVNTLESEGEHSIPRLKKHLLLIDKKRYSLFRRIEMHTYRQFPNNFKRNIESTVIQHFNRWDVNHEHYHLVKETFSQLSKKTQRQFLTLINTGPSKETIDNWKIEEETYGNNLVDVRTKYWKVRKLEPISKFLKGRLKKNYEEMVKAVGKPEFPDFHSYHYGVRTAQPVTDLVDGLDEEKVIDFLKSHIVKDDLDSLFTDGTKEKFQEYVEKEPLRYSKRVSDLLSMDSLFSISALSGLENSVKAGKEIDWESMLPFCKKIPDLIIEGKYVEPKGYDILRHIASFLESGLQNKQFSIPLEFRDNVWQILLLLIKIRNEESDWEENYPDKNWDSHGISINTASGATFHAVFQYAIWIHNHLKGNNSKPQLAQEVKDLVQDYLDGKITNTISRHAVVGFQFLNLYFFDKDLALHNKPNIFSNNNVKLARAAWDSYLLNNVYPYAIKELFSEYSSHIKKLKSPQLENDRLSQFDERVIQHITLGYVHKFKDADDLFDKLINTKNSTVLSHCAWFVGSILRGYKEKPNKSLDLDKIRNIWSKSMLTGYGETGWWFTNSPFSKNETIRLFLKSLKKTNGKIDFAYKVQEELETYAKSHPMKTIECLELMFKSDEDRLSIHVGRESTKKILKTILESRNTKAVSKSKSLIHYLGTLGFNEYGELLQR